MIVELVGAPGSGKSTIAPVLAAELGASLLDLGTRWGDIDRKIISRRRRRALWLSAIARNPLLLWRLVPAVDHTSHDIRLCLEVIRRDRVSRIMTRRNGRWLVDEGPVQRLLTYLAHSERWHGDAALFARSVTWPDVVVQLPVEPNTAVDRVWARGGINPMLGQSRDEALAFIGRYEMAAKQLMAASDAPIVRGGSLDKIVGDLAHLVSGECQTARVRDFGPGRRPPAKQDSTERDR